MLLPNDLGASVCGYLIVLTRPLQVQELEDFMDGFSGDLVGNIAEGLSVMGLSFPFFESKSNESRRAHVPVDDVNSCEDHYDDTERLSEVSEEGHE